VWRARRLHEARQIELVEQGLEPHGGPLHLAEVIVRRIEIEHETIRLMRFVGSRQREMECDASPLSGNSVLSRFLSSIS
jgi:hypothetical protein